ncbi:hypothetical protein ACG04R_09345 [Roseateles sp. BYS78W]|uniref:DUF4145 domain-containing protein n=1 Tax=Pelomonas candidula TaxID=3299025 RepID=A0ABW7HAD2_9BURK
MTTSAEILDRIRNIKADTAGVMEVSRWVEWVLMHRFDAQGTGIHSRVTSVEHRLPADLLSDLRYLGSVRNDFAHNPLAEVRSPERYTRTSQAVLRRLLEMPPHTNQSATTRTAAAAEPASGRSRGFVALVAGACLLLFVAIQWPRLMAAASDELNRLPGPREAAEAQDAQPTAPVDAPSVQPPAPPTRQTHATRMPKPAAQARAETRELPASAPTVQAEPGDAEVTLEQLRALKSRL